MKIIYIHDMLVAFGGIERIVIDKINYLVEHNHQVYLITCSQGNHPYSFKMSSKVNCIDLDVKFYLQYNYKYPIRLWYKWVKNRKFIKRLQNQIDIINPDIIIGFTNFKPDVICLLKTKAKIIIESHCAKHHTGINDGVIRNAIFQWIQKQMVQKSHKFIENNSDAIVALTLQDAKLWNHHYKVITIPNMLTHIPQVMSKNLQHRVISVGRLSYQKGFDRLIEIWTIVNHKHPNWILDIYGEGELENHLLKLINKYKLQESITIHPPVHNIFEEFKNSSIFVLPSYYEGFGLVLIEAMASGIPCISFDCPFGPSEIINNGKDGFIIPNGNLQAMADKICYLMENENVRKEMGKKACQSAMRYAPENIMPLWEKLFNELVKC